MDLLSDILDQSGYKSSMLKRCIASGPWSNTFTCEKSMEFHLVSQGHIFLKSKVIKTPIKLERGDLVLMSRGLEHELTTDLKLRSKRFPISQDGDFDALHGHIQIISGHYEFWHKPVHPFFNEVPDFYVIRGNSIQTHDPLYAALQLLSLEVSKPKLGSTLVTKSLIDILFSYILQRLIEERKVKGSSWSAAVKDPQVNKALSLMHQEWSKAWTLEDLAASSGISRAGLAAKFKKLMGESPLRYLAVLRAQRAIDLLATTDQSLEQIAQNIGYSNAFSFSKMFKSVTGESPRDFRRKSSDHKFNHLRIK